MPATTPPRNRSTLISTLLLWFAFYGSVTLFRPALLDDADSVHAEVAREMLLRHDPVTLYANGIRYLEKAPLMYWLMALSMRCSQLMGAAKPVALAAAARVPIALSVLALALLVEAFARRLYGNARAGLYAALATLSSFGIFIFSRITLPDTMVCLFTTAALYAVLRSEEEATPARRWPLLFAIACVLNVLSKGLIGVVFPLLTAAFYLLLTRGWCGALARVRALHPWFALAVFVALAAPWHIAAGLANPTQGYPAPFVFAHAPEATFPWQGHWQVPLPSDGNVRGWWWFYFMNEHVLRYLNLRIPRDYDTDPLLLFWGLCLVWIMPWSAFLFNAVARALPLRSARWRSQFRRHDLTPLERAGLLLCVAAALPLIFFSFSTRQEYYVLPALPPALILIAGWLAATSFDGEVQRRTRRAAARATLVLTFLGSIFAAASVWFLLHTRAPAPGTDLASLLAQNPADYALSMGHFLDLNAQALGLFRLPLTLAAVSLFAFPLASYLMRRGHLDSSEQTHRANLLLAAGAFGFTAAAWLGLNTFAPVLTSAQLAQRIAPHVHAQDLVVIHGEYEAGSTLGIYLQRPANYRPYEPSQFIHILDGRSSNLWYGSFFPDAPKIFMSDASLAAAWQSPRRVFLWQSLTDPPRDTPPGLSPIYVLAQSGGKAILSNQPDSVTEVGRTQP